MFVIDAHLDLSMNALHWDRDLTRTVDEIRKGEVGMRDRKDRENNTVSLPEMRRGEIGLCVATLIGRSRQPGEVGERMLTFNNPEIAWSATQGQLAWYREMETAGEMTQIVDLDGLNQHLDLWMNNTDADAKLPIGYVLSLEGADSILTPKHLERSYEQGLRAIGMSHYGPGRYAGGTHNDDGLSPLGLELLKEIERLGIILDATHLCDPSFWEAMDNYSGPVWASHNNCRALVPDVRQFDDDQLKELIKRGGVIGAAFDAWMLAEGWMKGKTMPSDLGVTLETVVNHIDHVCQLAGNANHAAIGTDLDGGYGTEQSPADLETIADLQNIPAILTQRGYSEEDVAKIMHGNWIRFLRNAWA